MKTLEQVGMTCLVLWLKINFRQDIFYLITSGRTVCLGYESMLGSLLQLAKILVYPVCFNFFSFLILKTEKVFAHSKHSLS